MPPNENETFSIHPTSQFVVPWMSRLEWDEVRKKIFSSNLDDVIWAINRVGVWKTRSFSKIPIAIEATAALARAFVMDMKNTSPYDNGNISMMYGMALVRFVNLLTDTDSLGKLMPLHVTAEKLGIPDWVVNVRHQIAHTMCPSLTLLRIAVREALIWIENNYWKMEAKKMMDGSQSRVCQNIHTDFDLAQTILNEYRQNISQGPKSQVKKKAAENFKELLSKNNEVLCVLLKKGFLFPDEKTFANKKQKSFSPLSVLSLWIPILKTVMETNHLTLLHEKMIYNLATEDAWYSSCILDWLLSILDDSRAKNQKDSLDSSVKKFINCCRETCDWIVLLRASIKTPTISTLKFLPLLIEKSGDVLNKKQQEQLLGLMSAYCEGSVRFNLDVIGPDDYHTVNNLKSLNPKDDDAWKPYQDSVDWSHYPIGLLPHQVGAHVLDLNLPAEVDALHQHDFPAWPSSQNKSEMDSEEEIDKPDLEARLLIGKHSKKTVEWPREQLSNIINEMNLF